MVVILGLAEDFFVLNVVGEVIFVEVEAGGPLLALAEAEVFHELRRGVAEPGRDGTAHGFLGKCLCAGPGVVRVAVFLRLGEDDGDMAKDDAAFGHADAFDSLETADGEIKGAVTGKADIFGGEDDHAAGDEFRIFPAGDHAGEVI